MQNKVSKARFIGKITKIIFFTFIKSITKFLIFEFKGKVSVKKQSEQDIYIKSKKGKNIYTQSY